MPLTGFAPTVPASELPQTHALDPAATRIGKHRTLTAMNIEQSVNEMLVVKWWSIDKCLGTQDY